MGARLSEEWNRCLGGPEKGGRWVIKALRALIYVTYDSLSLLLISQLVVDVQRRRLHTECIS